MEPFPSQSSTGRIQFSCFIPLTRLMVFCNKNPNRFLSIKVKIHKRVLITIWVNDKLFKLSLPLWFMFKEEEFLFGTIYYHSLKQPRNSLQNGTFQCSHLSQCLKLLFSSEGNFENKKVSWQAKNLHRCYVTCVWLRLVCSFRNNVTCTSTGR